MQEKPIQIKGQFLEDSAKIGQHVHYSLQVLHSKNQEIFFTVVGQKIGVFEPIKKEYFPTKTTQAGSLDSAVYTYKFFDIADKQLLSVPIYIINDADCTKISPIPDTIFLKRLVPHPELVNMDLIFEKLPIPLLKPKTDLKNIFLGGIIIIFLAGILYWIFGKTIYRYFLLYQLWRKNLEFKRTYQRQTRNVANTSKGLQSLENAIRVWKVYLENLIKVPFSTFTTTEMLDYLKDKRLTNALKDVDSAVYGGNYSAKTLQSVNILVEIASTVYQNERKKVNAENRK